MNTQTEKESKWISIGDYIKKIGKGNSTVYDAVKLGYLPFEMRGGKKMFQWFNKIKNDMMFEEAKAKYKHELKSADLKLVAAKKANKTLAAHIEKNPSVKVPKGRLIPIKMFSEMSNVPYPSLAALVKKGLFDLCSIEVENMGASAKRAFFAIAWPGEEYVEQIRDIMLKPSSLYEKQLRLGNLFPLEEPTEEPEATPESVPEPAEILEEILDITPPQRVAEPSDYHKYKDKVSALETKMKILEERHQKLEVNFRNFILKSQGFEV